MKAEKIKVLATGLLLGILIGAAGLNAVMGKHLDRAEFEILKLRTELEDKSEQLESTEKELKVKKQASVVNEITIHVNYADEYKKLKIESEVKKLLSDVKGQEVRSLDPLLVTNIVDGRTISADNRKYNLTVRGTLVSEKIIMYVDAGEVKEHAL
ncbi:hypothetical protein [Phosphitispora sp. TUW77]|uniref:hypothetical protein n=1 Tax=Phosphitispora sp. TUW77 TaxID=3152361 RepID=UPI003AB9044A